MKQKIKTIIDVLIGFSPIFSLIMLNLLMPLRAIHRIKNGRFVYGRAHCSDNKFLNSHAIDGRGGVDIQQAVEILLKHGVLVIHNYFDEKIIDAFEKKYEKYISYPGADVAAASGHVLPLTPELLNLWRDEKLVSIMENAFKTKIYGRNYPKFQVNYPRINPDGSIQNKKTASDLHVDHTSIIQAAIFFTEVRSDTSRMQALSGSHRYPISPYPLSNNNQQAMMKRFEVLDCIGGIGTVQIHFGDTLHRFFPVGGSCRLWLKFEYSDGYNILFDPWAASETLSHGIDKDSFAGITKDEFFGGLYPKTPRKGYRLKNGKIFPVKKDFI